ncbi:MAG: polysaccharide biosynthesis/export family protein [Kaiparowitsia implicata GSE-PSE-MK54-09C]|jgi:polysaccharide export outer membrane protein|nr:polysaccharide biosynthesis/export family protein [Kaiparowitsia implicata GSE-PSE-MK54-09C]
MRYSKLPLVSTSFAALVLIGSAVQSPALAQSMEPDGPSIQELAPSSELAPDGLELDQPLPPSAFSFPDYILGPGDQLSISVYGYEEFNELQKVVNSDGTIILPLIGTTMVAGRTPAQLDTYIEQQLNQYLVDPEVSLTLVGQRPVVVTVAGEVQRPGPVRLRSLTNAPGNNVGTESPTLTTALVQAGGVTRFADIRQVILQRYNPNGESEPTVVNLWENVSVGTGTTDIVLQDGDTIFIPRLSADATLDRRLLSQSSLAPATVRVRVVGEVNTPGEIEISPNSSLSSAVATAGGPTEDARLSRVAYVRMNDEGQIERYDVDLRNLVDNFQVQEGDVVIVPRRNSSSFLATLGRILNPFGSIVNIINGLDEIGNRNND